MADTKRLYYEDVYIKEFRGTVTNVGKQIRANRILLDQSALLSGRRRAALRSGYPERYQSHRRSGGRGGTDPLYRGTSWKREQKWKERSTGSGDST